MIEVEKVGAAEFKVRIRLADLENMDYMDYANKFYDYRISSVWSSPEILS